MYDFWCIVSWHELWREFQPWDPFNLVRLRLGSVVVEPSTRNVHLVLVIVFILVLLLPQQCKLIPLIFIPLEVSMPIAVCSAASVLQLTVPSNTYHLAFVWVKMLGNNSSQNHKTIEERGKKGKTWGPLYGTFWFASLFIFWGLHLLISSAGCWNARGGLSNLFLILGVLSQLSAFLNSLPLPSEVLLLYNASCF